MTSSFHFDPEKLLRGLENFESKSQAAIRKYAETSANKLETEAKINARWENHTGDARRRMKGDSLPVAEGYKLRLAHGVDYGIFLELAHERKFAIIEETIDRVGTSDIMPGFQNLMGRLG